MERSTTGGRSCTNNGGGVIVERFFDSQLPTLLGEAAIGWLLLKNNQMTASLLEKLGQVNSKVKRIDSACPMISHQD